MAKAGKLIGGFSALLILAALAGFFYFKFIWVFSDGTKTGELNSLTYTGYFFKTYEGEMILTGYGSKNASGTVQSKTFKFSVKDKEVAQKLTEMTGLRVTVHYKEYKGALPWRGYERAIVDKVEEDTSYEKIPDDSQFFL
ncbi:MAG: hypothetical protein IKI85_06455 [Bacteroidales bacterium]|nr:hypothetical protein [Bacteroidales bacterium]MBR3990168.1 hypothetical protein [Bacteroidales bacterium]